jgi:hypothetical protein
MAVIPVTKPARGNLGVLKFPLKGRHFQTVEEIQCAVTRGLNKISNTAFLEDMKKLKERANKFIDQTRNVF